MTSKTTKDNIHKSKVGNRGRELPRTEESIEYSEIRYLKDLIKNKPEVLWNLLHKKEKLKVQK